LQTSDNKAPSDNLKAKYIITFEREATKKEDTIVLTPGFHYSKMTKFSLKSQLY